MISAPLYADHVACSTTLSNDSVELQFFAPLAVGLNRNYCSRLIMLPCNHTHHSALFGVTFAMIHSKGDARLGPPGYNYNLLLEVSSVGSLPMS